MELLKNISILWSLVHTLVLFLLLFESRYSNKKTAVITVSTMGPLIFLNLLLFAFLDSLYGLAMLLTLSLPSCIVFYILSKYRDARFFFVFCMVDTTVLEIVYITNILDHYLTPDTNLVMFITRLLAYPLLELWVYKALRPMFRSVQKQIAKGWVSYALIGILFYAAITMMMAYPTPITERLEYVPVIALLFLLMPAIYVNIISTLRRMLDLHERSERENLLRLQVSNLTSRMDELSAADDRFRMERHNFRHKLKTLASLIRAGQYDECLILLAEYNENLDRTRTRRYCQHAVLDAVLSTYIKKAEESSISVSMGFDFPSRIPMSETELATVFANALENAINACEKLPQEQRFIDIKVINRPRFMIRIVNSFDGKVEFDNDDIPVNRENDHGFGTRFIAAFCQKNNGYFQFEAKDKKFSLLINF